MTPLFKSEWTGLIVVIIGGLVIRRMMGWG
jgi:hypothetical protein